MNHIKKQKLIFFNAAFWNSQEIIKGASSLSLSVSLSPLICYIRIRITKMIYFRKWIKERVVRRASPLTCWPSRLLILQHFAAVLYFNVRQTNSCAGLKRTRFWRLKSSLSGFRLGFYLYMLSFTAACICQSSFLPPWIRLSQLMWSHFNWDLQNIEDL